MIWYSVVKATVKYKKHVVVGANSVVSKMSCQNYLAKSVLP